jgi:hypothetical protein
MSDFAEVCLEALAKRELGRRISVGGGLGLLHYLDYRHTHDVDAWWDELAGPDARREVVETIRETLTTFGEVRTRAWGDVVSVELRRDGRTVFSFQIASRSARLAPSLEAPWVAVLLDDLPDLVASKMVALVERGAPRDFLDVRVTCQAGLVTPAECWALWRQRQATAGSDCDPRRARLAVETHLARIEQHRRLDEIGDPAARAEAADVRHWFLGTFLDAIESA